MQHRARHAWLGIALAFVITATYVSAPASLFGAPAASPSAANEESPDDPEFEAKKAEKAAALRELERMRESLAAKVSGYVTLARRIQRTQQDIVEVSDTIAQMDESIDQSEQALRDRAIQLYRTDRVGMLEILFSAESISDLFDRFTYVVAASYYDSRLVTELRLARQESMWLKENLNERIDQLLVMQEEADFQRQEIELEIAAQEEKAASIGEDLARFLREKGAPQDFSGSNPDERFSPDTVISEYKFRDTASMSVIDIQAFLERQSGSLATFTGPDHGGEVKSAAQMIHDAAQRWGISPKVILVTLQKEQSLLSRANPSQRACDWAMGCGKMDGRTLSRYQGFGNQIWYGAASLSKNAGRWRTGAKLNIDGNGVQPTNSGTYGLYKYTPHIRGTMSFWLIYWRYFGDPVN